MNEFMNRKYLLYTSTGDIFYAIYKLHEDTCHSYDVASFINFIELLFSLLKLQETCYN